MSTIAIYVPTPEHGQWLKTALTNIAAGHGFYTTTGTDAGDRGNIRELLESIAAGETATLLMADAPRDALITFLAEYAYRRDTDPTLAEAMSSTLASLTEARRRESQL